MRPRHQRGQRGEFGWGRRRHEKADGAGAMRRGAGGGGGAHPGVMRFLMMKGMHFLATVQRHIIEINPATTMISVLKVMHAPPNSRMHSAISTLTPKRGGIAGGLPGGANGGAHGGGPGGGGSGGDGGGVNGGGGGGRVTVTLSGVASAVYSSSENANFPSEMQAL